MEVVIIKEMIGKTFTNVFCKDDELHFEELSGIKYVFYHEQDCCESVWIEDIIGEIETLINSPIIIAEKRRTYDHGEAGYGEPSNDVDSVTFTFYHFATLKGYVDVRWIGSSNGYYSEEVDFKIIENE